jgi:hypothetical protein
MSVLFLILVEPSTLVSQLFAFPSMSRVSPDEVSMPAIEADQVSFFDPESCPACIKFP